MLEFIAEYWLEFAFGIVAIGLTTLAKYFHGLYKRERTRQRAEDQQAIITELAELIQTEHSNTHELLELERQKSLESDEVLELRIDDVDDKVSVIKEGILQVQGKQFKKECRELLKDDHEITLEEFEEIELEHEVYNKLGGNHNGDKLFSLVNTKFQNNLLQK